MDKGTETGPYTRKLLQNIDKKENFFQKRNREVQQIFTLDNTCYMFDEDSKENKVVNSPSMKTLLALSPPRNFDYFSETLTPTFTPKYQAITQFQVPSFKERY